MKFAAIDIGSNGVRFLISRPLSHHSPAPEFKKVEYTRLPLRLGDDVFKRSNVSKNKLQLLKKAMKAFALLMEIYHVDGYKAYATSALRDAHNADKVIQSVLKYSGIQIELISGLQESQLIIQSFLHLLKPQEHYIHIDVGGGSTEVSHLYNHQVLFTHSFNIGTVRLRENKVDESEKQDMESQIRSYFCDIPNLKAIGTGGNMNKLYALAEVMQPNFISLPDFQSLANHISTLNQNQKVYSLKLNPDRAEVIDYAAHIYLNILKTSLAQGIWAPNKGLKDGMLLQIWRDFQSQSNRKFR